MKVPDTLLDFFNEVSVERREFLVYDDGFRTRSYTYAETAKAAHGFASALQREGLGKGDKIVFWSENRPEWVIALWGCLLNGSIAVPIDYRASRDFLIKVSRIVNAKLLLLGDNVEDLPNAGTVTRRLSDVAWRDLDPSAFAPVSMTRDDTIEIIFTSGATAEPKGVVLTHRNVLANILPVWREVRKYRKYARPFAPIRFLNLLPLSHMFGQAMATFVPPMLGGTVVFVHGYNPHEIIRQTKRRRISVIVSVPKMLEVLADHVVRLNPEVGQPSMGNGQRATGRGPLFTAAERWWRYRAVHRLFGWKFWSFVVGAAPLDSALESFWKQLGFVVVQGYGLTETAPIVSLNHPFSTSQGSVGKAIAGVEIKIAPDGEILVRGENVTTGYYGAPEATGEAFEGEWFHTGDIGQLDEAGRLFIRGRKKEMIVTPEGLNVFPEDVERIVNALPGVKDSAAVGVTQNGAERVHVALIVDVGVNPDEIVKAANTRLADHQRIRGARVWTTGDLPRTEGTKKLKRHEIRAWLETGAPPSPGRSADRSAASVIARYAGRRALESNTTLEELGLSSLERIEMMVALEDALDTTLDESAFAGATTMGDIERLIAAPAIEPPQGPVSFPAWNRSRPVQLMRAVSQTLFLMPLTRLFAWIHVDGRQNLEGIAGPVIFAANHQSHMDVPVILAALPGKWRRQVAPAMAKEFFAAYFFPDQHSRGRRIRRGLEYHLSAAFFNTFPLPQREAGARQTLRYAGELVGEGFSVLIFPEGKRTERGEIARFRPGVGIMASRLGVPVVPIRLEGVNRVLATGWKMAKPGKVKVTFGAPLRLIGDDYAELAGQVEAAVRKLGD